MELVLEKNLEYGYTTISELQEDGLTVLHANPNYLVVSDVVDVEFNMISDAEIVTAEIDAIDDAINKEMADSEVRVNAMRQRKAELLAIGQDK